MKKRIAFLALCLVLLLCLFPVLAAADGDEQKCGDNLYWSFNSATDALTITGSGDMYTNNSPWNDWKDRITSVSLPNGMTTISNYAFDGCTGLTSITIPSSVTCIGYHALSTGLTDVYYTGTEEQREQIDIDDSNYAFKFATWHYGTVLPTITTQPKDVTVAAGKKVTFTVAASDAESYTWQYQKPGSSTWTNVSSNGAAATYTLTTAAKHNGYAYRCAVKNGAGTVYTKAVTLTVQVKPTITTQPKKVTVAAGEKATFTVVADGATKYQWQYQKPGSSTWTDVSKNGTSATYTLTTAAKHNGYKYRCKITNAKGSMYTSIVTLTVK